MLEEQLARFPQDHPLRTTKLDLSLPPMPVETRWTTLTGMCRWLNERFELVQQLLRFWASAASEQRGITVSTRQYAKTNLAAMESEPVRAAIVVLAEFDQVFFQSELFFSQGSDDVKPGFHAPLQPRRVVKRLEWLKSAKADPAKHMPRSVAAGFQQYVEKLVNAAIDSLMKHQAVWLHMPLVLDALALDEGPELAAALMQPRPQGKHDLLQLLNAGDVDLLRRHPLYAHMGSIADGQPSEVAEDYLQRHSLARLVHSQSTEASFSILGHLLTGKPRLSKMRVEMRQRHLENDHLPSGRTTKTVVLRRATVRPTLTQQGLRAAKTRLQQQARAQGAKHGKPAQREFSATAKDSELYKSTRYSRPHLSTSKSLAELQQGRASITPFPP